ncbi:hypothetical protein DF046_19545 [Burkholderia cepacia]|uniref:hypothetical protein n=1 Tax=Burkholderia cepacia TaxID=292 RepID=UPI000751D7CE|nr:hypothetical protein [Burkholderia cepacia]KVL12385.1 hypothetical protein WJ46_28675 [Burkholderia cepacia]KVQ29032.1 hypothetical protein WK02_21195 [Burkholderia cepacia]KVZ22371.1 hypothetical protein WL14_21060 [Burkholderia cepacia]RQT51646.1 hypothetical protein DF046_19545 [Burkholderia cepacia]
MANATGAVQPMNGAHIVKLSDYRTILREIPPPSVEHEAVESSLLAIDVLLKTARNMVEKLRAEVSHG